MESIDLWRYELDFLNMTAIGTTTAEIKSLYPWLRTKGFTAKDFGKYPFYDTKELVLRHYFRRNGGPNTKREIQLHENVFVKFNPPAYMDLVKQVLTFEDRKIGDLFLFFTKYPDSRNWLLPKQIMEPLSKKPWEDYSMLLQVENSKYATGKHPDNTCFVEDGEMFRIH